MQGVEHSSAKLMYSCFLGMASKFWTTLAMFYAVSILLAGVGLKASDLSLYFLTDEDQR